VTDQPSTPQGTKYNVIADFADGAGARAAIMDLERKGVEAGRISLLGVDQGHSARAEGDELRMKDKATTKRVGSRAITGAVAGALVGALIGWGIAAAFTEGQSGRLVIAAMGGAIVGFLLGGLWAGYSNVAASGEAVEETYDTDTTGGPTQLVVRTDDSDEFDRAMKALEGSGATKLSRLDRDGRRVAS
jgi:F0F1-type ATP synthase assembly protein I